MKNLLTIVGALILCSCNQNQKDSTEVDNRRESQKIYADIPDNSIINLYDAFGDNLKLEKDFGFSCIIKYKDKTILFDAGSNADIFKRNVEILKIDLTEIDFAVASHAHFDHINGFDYLLEINPKVKIYFPFDPFWGANFPFDLVGQDSTITTSLEKKMQYFDGDFRSYKFNQSGRFWQADIDYIEDNKEIAPGIKLIATSSPYMGYFTKYPNIGFDLENMPIDQQASDHTNFIKLQELSLSLKTENGEVLIVGCSHSTVEKIILDTKTYTQNEIELVYGGYHLLPYDNEILTELTRRLKDEFKVNKVAPAHCTGHLAFKILQDNFKENYVFAGLGETVIF